METREQILTELQEIAPFLGRGDVFRIPYTIPAGYFTDFADMLMNRIHLEAVGFSESAGKEIHELSPLLAGLQHKNTYQLPEGFFESLQIKIPITERTPSKMVSIPGKQIISMPMRMVRYAAAACIVGLIGIVTFNISNHRNITDPILGLTTVSAQDMANYLDADDIHWTPGVSSSAAETASVGFSDDDIHDLLKGVPDVELEQYSPTLPEQKGTVN
jgi:hypothetical protein